MLICSETSVYISSGCYLETEAAFMAPLRGTKCSETDNLLGRATNGKGECVARRTKIPGNKEMPKETHCASSQLRSLTCFVKLWKNKFTDAFPSFRKRQQLSLPFCLLKEMSQIAFRTMLQKPHKKSEFLVRLRVFSKGWLQELQWISGFGVYTRVSQDKSSQGLFYQPRRCLKASCCKWQWQVYKNRPGKRISLQKEISQPFCCLDRVDFFVSIHLIQAKVTGFSHESICKSSEEECLVGVAFSFFQSPVMT